MHRKMFLFRVLSESSMHEAVWGTAVRGSSITNSEEYGIHLSMNGLLYSDVLPLPSYPIDLSSPRMDLIFFSFPPWCSLLCVNISLSTLMALILVH